MTKPDLHWTEKLALKPDEVAAIAGVSRSSVYDMINDGTLPHVEMHGRRVVLRDTLVRWMKERECIGRQAAVATLTPRPYTRRQR